MLLTTDPKARKQLQLWTFLMGYFPRTFLAVVEVARKGNEQHNPDEPLHWSREKSPDQMNAAFNHLFDYGTGSKIDTDGARHLAKAIWRLSAQNELDMEAEDKLAVSKRSQPAPTEGNSRFELAPARRCHCGKFPLYGGQVGVDSTAFGYHGLIVCSS